MQTLAGYITIYVYLCIEPTHEILVLIAYANSEGSGATAHPRSHARAFSVRTYGVRIRRLATLDG